MTLAQILPPPRRRISVLRHDRFRLLFFAAIASMLGNWLALIALQVDVYDRTSSGWWVGALLIANILPAIVIGVLFGPLVDRLSRKGLMIASDIGRLAVFVALPFVNSPTAIVALAVVAGIGNGFFRPAVLAGMPNLVADEELPAANALLQTVEWVAQMGGPLAGGVIVAASGPHLAYWVNALTFGISVAFVAWIPARLLQSEKSIGRGHWSDLREGFETVVRSRELLTVTIVWTVAMVAAGLINLAEIFLARRSYGAGDFGFGLLWAGSGAGLVAGGLVANALLARRGVGVTYPRALLVFSLGVAAAAAAPNVWVGAAAMAVSGIGNGVAAVTNITLVQRGAPDRLRGRALTAVMSVNYSMLLVAFIVAGPLTDAAGPRVVYAVAAGALLLAAGVAQRLLAGSEA